MIHSISIEGFAFRLRPITPQDSAFVIELRTTPELSQFLHQTSNRIEDQIAWFANYEKRAGDYYFVVERKSNNTPEGLISVYDIDPETKSGEWGRWVLRPGSLAAIESVWLMFRVAFEVLDLSKVYSRTIANNTKVVSFHDSCGVEQRKLIPNYTRINEQLFDVVEHTVDRFAWSTIRPKLEKLSERAAQRGHRGQQSLSLNRDFLCMLH